MRQHHDFDWGTNSRFFDPNQERKTPDELRRLIVEFQLASPYFTSVEQKLLDQACARLAQLEAGAR